jgi:hypothetical protein
VIYLPIFFICITGGECDFVYAKPVASRAICETMNAEYTLRLEAAEEIVAYKSICVPVRQGPRPTDRGLNRRFQFLRLSGDFCVRY